MLINYFSARRKRLFYKKMNLDPINKCQDFLSVLFFLCVSCHIKGQGNGKFVALCESTQREIVLVETVPKRIFL